MNYYLYAHYKNNVLRYVGIGSGRRAYKGKRNRYWKNVFKDSKPEVRIMHDNLSKEQACELEVWYISFFRKNGFKLCNITDGGEHSEVKEESKKLMSLAKRGKPFKGKRFSGPWTSEMKRDKSKKQTGSGNSFYGKHHSNESKNKISKANKKYDYPATCITATKKRYFRKQELDKKRKEEYRA